jgi:3',5'-cyclic AMP phosphodiesterase CpdA
MVGEYHRIMGAQYTWLKNDLSKASGTAKHIFVFLHEPAYPVSLHIGSSLDAYPNDRDRLMALLKQYHVDALIAGHEHLYDYGVHDGVVQIISGGAGAPLYPSPHGGSFYNYLLITIDGDRAFLSVVRPGSIFPAPSALPQPAVAQPAH